MTTMRYNSASKLSYMTSSFPTRAYIRLVSKRLATLNQ